MTSHFSLSLWVHSGYKVAPNLHVPVYTIAEFHMRIIFSCICGLIKKSQHYLLNMLQAAGFQRWIPSFSETGAGCYYVPTLNAPTLGSCYTHGVWIGIVSSVISTLTRIGIFIPTTYELCRKKRSTVRVNSVWDGGVKGAWAGWKYKSCCWDKTFCIFYQPTKTIGISALTGHRKA